jgi:PIN domain nuclease of toxin-antitoxin system
MKYLIDTNIFLWFAEDATTLPIRYKMIIEEPANKIFLSIVSLWEIGIKHSLGKLQIPKRTLDELYMAVGEEFSIEILPLNLAHLALNSKLPFHHRDPFDRLIYAQSAVENLEFLFTDSVFHKYQGK